MSEIIEDRARTSLQFYPAELRCEKCESLIKVELSDLEYGRWKVRGYWFNDSAVIEGHISWACPACGHGGNFVDANTVPVGTRIDLTDAYIKRKAEGAPIV